LLDDDKERYTKGKSKAIPVTGRAGPYGFNMSRIPHFLDSRLTDGGQFVSLMSRSKFTSPGRSLALISVRSRVNPNVIVRLEGLGQLKNPMTSLEFEPVTSGL
jgi:hypothetical protein